MAEISATRWRELSPLMDELLDAQHDERTRRLAEIGAGDPALALQLEALLGERTGAERDAFLEGGAFRVAQEPSLAGQTVGAYTLREAIGQGGMGSVWRAERTDGRYHATVAIKFLNLALLGRGGVERFAREGSMLARLTHPNIARLFDAGVAASAAAQGQPYLVLEYIEGVPIDRYCDSNRLSIEKRLRLFLDVLAAVAHAHTNLILHRDLKPSNILVTAQGQVKLLDFGIGKLLAEQNTAASVTELTQLAGHAFTPDYAAPEQVQGGDVTTATDVYALGVLLYQLLAGRHPTALPTQTAVDRVRAVIDKEPEPISDAAAKADDTTVQARATAAPRLARALRGDLDNIVAKALKKQAAERYPTVAALAEDLRRYLDHQPVSARADSLAYRTSKFVRRYRLAVGAASATLLALLAGVVGTTWQAWEARTQRDRALAEIRYSRVNHEVLMLLLDDALRTGASDQWRELLDRAREQLRVRHENDPMSQARVLLMLAGRYATLNDERGEAAVTAALEQLEPTLPDPAVRAQITCARADLFLYARDVERARPLVVQAMQSLARIRDPDLGPLADCYQTDATLAVEEGDFERAITRASSLVDRFEREGLAGSRIHLYVLSNLQGIYQDTDRDGDALALHGRLEDALRAQSALNTSQHFSIQDRRATVLIRRGRFVEAETALRKMLESARMGAKGDAPAVLRSAIGRKLIFIGASTDGIALVESALPELEKVAQRNQLYFALFALIEGNLMKDDVAAASSRMKQLEGVMSDGRVATRERAEVARLQTLLALARGDAPAAQAQIEQMRTLAATLPRRARMEALRSELAAARVAALRNDGESAYHALDNAAAVERMADGKQRLEGPSAWRGHIFGLRAGLQQASGDKSAARTSAQAAIEQFDSTVPADHRWRADAQALVR